MERRKFLQKSLLGGMALPFFSNAQPASEPIFPKAIGKDSTIGIISPASALSRSAYERLEANFSQLGYGIKLADGARSRMGFLAGSDLQRVQDLHAMFRDPEVDAIICARGGYGTTRILSLIDYELIKQFPKPFVGYSDITSLLMAFYKKTGLVTYHGPVGASEFNDFTLDYLIDVIQKGKKVKIKSENTQVINGGEATGRLLGGNLSLLASLVGTPYDVDYTGHIIFMEEISESTYRIDRMLTQLINAGKFDGVAGIALGYFTNCDTKPDDPYFEYSIGLKEVLQDRLGNLGIPVAWGFPFGHEVHNATLPVGVLAKLNADKGIIKLLEQPVS